MSVPLKFKSTILAAFVAGLCFAFPVRAQIVPETEEEADRSAKGVVREVPRRPSPRKEVIEIKEAVEVRGKVRVPFLSMVFTRRSPDFSSLSLRMGMKRSFGESLRGELLIQKMPRYLGGLAPKKGG